MKTSLDKVFGSVKKLNKKLSFEKMREIALEDKFEREGLVLKKRRKS